MKFLIYRCGGNGAEPFVLCVARSTQFGLDQGHPRTQYMGKCMRFLFAKEVKLYQPMFGCIFFFLKQTFQEYHHSCQTVLTKTKASV